MSILSSQGPCAASAVGTMSCANLGKKVTALPVAGMALPGVPTASRSSSPLWGTCFCLAVESHVGARSPLPCGSNVPVPPFLPRCFPLTLALHTGKRPPQSPVPRARIRVNRSLSCQCVPQSGWAVALLCPPGSVPDASSPHLQGVASPMHGRYQENMLTQSGM
jgi:hypothetical protein